MFNYAALTDLRQLIRDDKETDSLFFVPYATILPLPPPQTHYLGIPLIFNDLEIFAVSFLSQMIPI